MTQINAHIKNSIRRIVLSPLILHPLSRLFRLVATSGIGSDICLQNGFLPLPVHFYSPIPDIRDLEKRNFWAFKSLLPGIDLQESNQIAFLEKIGSRYQDECIWPEESNGSTFCYFTKNPSFSFGCAASTHCMIRFFKPKAVVEIGSGMSTRVISAALSKNKEIDHIDSSYTVIDPYPGPQIRSNSSACNRLIQSRVELLDNSVFACLKANDILFIDSGHCVKTGGDVNFLFLEILPRLNPGVIVHIHDISLPYEYSRAYATSETFRQFWTEQYLLQAFLAFNHSFSVLLAMNCLMTDHMDVFRRVFKHYDPRRHPYASGSFWIQRNVD